jgi:CheY-like chemotaxis protein
MELMSEDFVNSAFRPEIQEEESFLFRKKRVLLIEEDWDLSQILQHQIHKDLDVDVERVQNIYQALGKMTHDSFDVLVLDCKFNPFQTLVEAEKFFTMFLEDDDIQTQKIPVIVLSSETDVELEGLESQFFRISAQVVKENRISNTLRHVENELNEILDI